MPENAPWWAVLAEFIIFGGVMFWGITWPQDSRDRRALLEARRRDRAERRKERNRRRMLGR
ncbi:hypothetical protein [Streptomyces sp. NPDC023838]|uniref:hypothetical protein n=1 Tax=Streptomyces sp. NPDC023838 TaxID=3154325 RepID=UPI0033C64315